MSILGKELIGTLNLRQARNVWSQLQAYRDDKQLRVQMSIYGKTSYKTDSTVCALRMVVGSDSHSTGMFLWELLISALRAGSDLQLLL